MIKKQRLQKIIIPVFFTAAILALVIYQWNEQMIVWQGSSSPLFRNLMDYPAWIRHGFDMDEIENIAFPNDKWHRFESPQLRIRDSPLPGLPSRSFLSPWELPSQEFTILIPIELDSLALAPLLNISGTAADAAMPVRTGEGLLVEPGIFLGYIGENWEIYVNGNLVRREIHIDKGGEIISRRNWRAVHFPISPSYLREGTNFLAIRILGDPSYGVTGLYYSSPYYMDDYNLIKSRQTNILSMILCGIFGYTAIYYLIIFLSLRKKEELYNLYYSIASVLLCVYTLMFSGTVNYIIPNSDISIRLEYISLFMVVPVLALFIEHFGMKKITKITKFFLFFYGILGITQIFFSNQYGDDVLLIWSATVMLYFSYIFIFNIANFYIRRKRGENIGSFVGNILIGLVVVYLCGLYDVLDIIFFHTSSSLFLYSTFIFHIGMAITLSQRYREMYSSLEESNLMLEEKVEERTMELIEASKAKSNFLANMSHEIRTPLNAVIGFSEIELRNDFMGNLLPSSTRENLSHIHNSGSLLLEIINEILDISKIESGRLELFPNEYETAPLLSGTISLNRIRIGEKPIQFTLEIPANFPAKLIGDELRIRQILNNLLSNAIKYTDSGTVNLKVECEKIDKGNINSSNKIIFTISDTGIGIKEEDIEKLFEKYSQLDAGSNRKNEGTGLGLPITKNLAEMMGGGISVESVYGSGSVFKAWVIQESCSTEAIGEAARDALRNFRYDIQYRTRNINQINLPDSHVLVVDDIPENLLVVRGFLQPYGLNVDTAGGGQEAIDLVKERLTKREKYDLIFMDHMMPGMDGVTALGFLRELEQEFSHGNFNVSKTHDNVFEPIPIVVLTSNALRGMNEFYIEHGFQDFLSKPVNPEELDAVIKKFLGNGQGNDYTRPVIPSEKNVNFNAELLSRNLDQLKHYLLGFESVSKIESAYFKKFTSFIKSLKAEQDSLVPDNARTDAHANSMAEAKIAENLTEAGEKEDAEKIREILPSFCKAMEKKLTVSNNESIQDMTGEIKAAIESGNIEAAKKIIKAMGSLKLSPKDRELYFTIYGASILDDFKQVLDAINDREKGGYHD